MKVTIITKKQLNEMVEMNEVAETGDFYVHLATDTKLFKPVMYSDLIGKTFIANKDNSDELYPYWYAGFSVPAFIIDKEEEE